ncbi:serpin family protein [Nocardia sp. GCM10030253]|uniref:serpin family protein n=1 Tax=Nocardia sp. GCM10030253 TaxID=3273404 RepID=UPI00362D685E
MQTSVVPHVVAANDLTARWCAAAGDDDFVVSGAGLWPLLALLTAAAEGRARSELEAAIGVSADVATTAALELLGTLAAAEDVSAALGLWVRADLPLHEDWARQLPVGTIDRLGEQGALDEWADKHTGGLIEKFPLRIDRDTVLVLATALAAKTTWETPFDAVELAFETGPWHRHRGPGLERVTSRLADASILHGPTPITRVVVTGTADVDVHLLLGAATPDVVLAAGLGALCGAVPIRTELPEGTTGPGLTVRTHTGRSRRDLLEVRLPPFEIRSAHNLCAQPELFGLATATDSTHGHFPEISPDPLYVTQGAQEVLARFTRTGFEAATVTAFNMARAASLPPERLVTTVSVVFDRPFGFVAVHRPTGLAVVAGWVANPATEPIG